MRRRANPSRALVAVAALGLAIGALVPGLGVPPPVDAIGCITNCTSLTVVLTQGSGTWQTTNSSYVPNNVINCTVTAGTMSGSCFHKYQNTYPPQIITIYYLVTPAVDYKGCNSATGNCSDAPTHGTFTMYQDTSITNWSFVFDPNGWGEIITSVVGTGSGSVTPDSLPTCTTAQARCDVHVPYQPTGVGYTAKADPGSYLASWSSGCPTSSNACTVTGHNGVAYEEVTFNLVGGPTPSPTAGPTATPKPTATPSPTPAATPTSTPGGPTPSPGHSAGASPGPTATAVNQTPSPGSTGAGAGPGGSSTPSSSSTPEGSASAGASDGPGSTGEVAIAGSGTPTPSPAAPGDLSGAASQGGGDGLTIAIVIAVGLVGAGLLIAVSILVATRMRRGPTGGG